MTKDPKVLIIDNGTEMMKAGFAGDDSPRAVFPNLVGRPRHQGVMVGMAQKDAYVGDEASMRRRSILRWKKPMERNIIHGWDDMTKIWHHTIYNELRCNPEEYAILMTENVLNPKQNRERTMKIIFETFNTPSFYLVNTAVCSLTGIGKESGIVLESGSVTQSVPIYQGFALRNAVQTLNIGGRDLTDYMMKLLNEYGYSFVTTAEREIVRDIKEKLCYVAENFEEEMKVFSESNEKDKQYELPDGQVIKVRGRERIQCFEAMFEPKMIYSDQDDMDGIHQMVYKSILESCLNNNEYKDIVLSGGPTMFGHGSYYYWRRNNDDTNIITPRLSNEMNKLLGSKDDFIIDGFVRRHSKDELYKDITNQIYKYSSPILECNIIARPERKYLSWIGGSIIGSLSTFQDLHITQEEYHEYGMKMLHRKCF